jgi:hypothetical protein
MELLQIFPRGDPMTRVRGENADQLVEMLRWFGTYAESVDVAPGLLPREAGFDTDETGFDSYLTGYYAILRWPIARSLHLVARQLTNLSIQPRRVAVSGLVDALTLVSGDHAAKLLVNVILSALRDESMPPAMVGLHTLVHHNFSRELLQAVLHRLPRPAPSALLRRREEQIAIVRSRYELRKAHLH